MDRGERRSGSSARWGLKRKLEQEDFQKIDFPTSPQSHRQHLRAHVIVIMRLKPIGTPWFDRTHAVSQCPVIPRETIIYKFIVDRPGTYMYHAHYGMQREGGLNEMIVVSLPEGQNEPFVYDFDQSFVFTDCYHNNTYEQATGLTYNPFVWVGEPRSLLE